MRSGTRLSTFILTVVLCPGLGTSDAANSDTPPEYSLHLQCEGAVPSSPGQVAALHEKAVALVQSSNFNSLMPRWKRDLTERLREYRHAVVGRHLLLTFAEPQVIATTGGVVTVKEIVIGLEHSQYANALHTIDEEGRIVAHAKYAGELYMELLSLVQSMDPARAHYPGDDP